MNKAKWIWRGLIGLALLFAIFFGVSRHVHMNRLAHDLRYGTHNEKVKAARELMERDRLYDKMQEMPKSARIKAMDAIEDIPGELAVKQCLILLKDTEPKVRERVTKTLTVLGKHHIQPLVPAMKDSDENVRIGAKAALAGIGPRVIPYVQPAVKQADLRAAACEVLVKLGEPSVPKLVELLEHDDQDVRMAAADSLGRIASKKATLALLKSTRDIAAVRRVAISALCAICDPRSTDLLVEVLSHTRDDGEVRARTARALSVIGGPKAIATLTAALGDWDSKVRTSVVTGLQRMGPPAVKPVIAKMSSGSEVVRRTGAAVLSGIDSPECAPELLRLIRDRDPAVRAAAAHGLGIQTAKVPANVLIPLLSDVEGRAAETAADSLVGMGGRAVPDLASVLRSSADSPAKFRAADALARIGKPAVPSLLSALGAGGDTTKWAAYALGRIGDPRARAALQKLRSASDPDLARIVQRALDQP